MDSFHKHYGDDKDRWTSGDHYPACAGNVLMEAKVVGVMQMIDSGDADDKIIAVLQDRRKPLQQH